MQTLSRRELLSAMVSTAAGLSLPPLAACSGAAPRGRSAAVQAPEPPREFRAAWVATVDNIDWPSRPGLSASEQRAEIERIVSCCAGVGLNAILLQVRPTADAIYRSKLEPWSAFLTGRSGQPPSPEYDPLEAWLETAHAAGLDLHAWVNPFRARHPKSIGADAAGHVSRARKEIVREYGPYLWLDPGEPAARDFALEVVADLLRRYPIDGVHMDDYFYPYPVDKVAFPDAGTHARYGGGKPLAAWRRGNIDDFVVRLRDVTRELSPGALVTVSPFGIWRPGHPAGVRGFDAYEGLYADSRRWLVEGWVDALMPQLYWKVESEGQPFEPLLDWWREQNPRGRHLWPGIYLTRIKPAGEPESWEAPDIVRQLEIIRAKPDVTGFALFSAVGLVDNRRGVSDKIGDIMRVPAFVPESQWAGGARPAPPKVRLDRSRRGLRVEPGGWGGDVRRWAVRVRRDGGWTVVAAPGGARQIAISPDADAAVVWAVGRNGLASEGVGAS